MAELRMQFYPEGPEGPVLEFLEEVRKFKPKAFAKISVDLKVLGAEGIRSGKIQVAPLTKKLWELKRSFEKIGYRILFCLHEGEIWLVHAFKKKTQKTPKQDIDLALRRVQEVLSR